MLTIEKLQAFGADTEEGLARCMKNEGLYLRLVGTITTEKNFDALKTGIEAGDLDKAFEAAHALKGVSGNLSLTPIYTPVVEITEQLRAKTEMDYTGEVEAILAKRDELKALCD